MKNSNAIEVPNQEATKCTLARMKLSTIVQKSKMERTASNFVKGPSQDMSNFYVLRVHQQELNVNRHIRQCKSINHHCIRLQSIVHNMHHPTTITRQQNEKFLFSVVHEQTLDYVHN